MKAIGDFEKGRNQCKACRKAKAKCEHDRQRQYCRACGGGSICEHDRQRSGCKECGGGSICEHDRQRNYCKKCSGVSICEHNRNRSQCKECGGSSICEHKRVRPQCKECGGSQICEHKRIRAQCKECGGSQICEHGRYLSQCKLCSPNSNAFCHNCREYLVTKRTNYLCSFCRPDSPARQRTREFKVKAFLEQAGYTFIHNRAVNTTTMCRAFRPDFLFDCDTFYVIVECDEDAHRYEDYECERAREYAIRDFLDRPCVFIRFNPDRCLGSDGKNIDVRKRYPVLKRTIDFYLENGFDGIDLCVEYLFY